MHDNRTNTLRVAPIILLISLSGLFASCSSLPKEKREAGVTAKKEQAALLLERGNSEYNWENLDSALHQYGNAFSLSAAVDWQEGMIRALLAQSRSADGLGRGEDAKIYLDRALFLLAGDGSATAGSKDQDAHAADSGLTLAADNRRCEWLLFNKSAAEALELSDSLLPRAAELKESREAGVTWRIRAAVLKRLERYPEALEAADRALAIDTKRGAIRDTASDHYIRSSVLSLQNNIDQAVKAMHKALDLDKRIENSPGIAQDLYALGLIHEKRGEQDAASYHFRRSALVYRAASLPLPNRLQERLETEDSTPWAETEE